MVTVLVALTPVIVVCSTVSTGHEATVPVLLGNLDIAHLYFCAISWVPGLRGSENVQRNLEIEQIPKLYTHVLTDDNLLSCYDCSSQLNL